MYGTIDFNKEAMRNLQINNYGFILSEMQRINANRFTYLATKDLIASEGFSYSSLDKLNVPKFVKSSADFGIFFVDKFTTAGVQGVKPFEDAIKIVGQMITDLGIEIQDHVVLDIVKSRYSHYFLIFSKTMMQSYTQFHTQLKQNLGDELYDISNAF